MRLRVLLGISIALLGLSAPGSDRRGRSDRGRRSVPAPEPLSPAAIRT